MEITRTSIISGVTTTKDIPVTSDQLKNWKNGELIQNVMPNLSPGEREFIKTGITPEEWDTMFGGGEND